MATITVGPSVGSILSGNNSFTISLTGTTVGRSVVVGIAWQSAFGTVSSVDCSGQAMTLQGSPQATANFSKVQFATLDALSSGGDKTITITMSNTASANNQASGFAAELSDTDTSDVFDAVNGATGTSSSPSVSITTGQNNNAVFGIAVADSTSSGDFTAGSGFTIISLTNSSNRVFDAEYDADVGVAGAKTVDFGLAGSQTWAVQAISINTAPSSFARTPGAGSIAVEGAQATSGLSVVVSPVSGGIALSGLAATLSTTLSPVIVPGVGAIGLATTAAAVSTSFTTSASVTLAAHTISAAGSTEYVSGAVVLLGHTGSGSATSEVTATAAITLPVHTISAGGNNALNKALLAHTISATAVGGAVASLSSSLLTHVISAQSGTENVLTASVSLLAHRVSASGIPENVATLSRSLPAHRISAELLAGNTASAAVSLLAHTLNVLSYPEGVASASITLAGHYLDAYAAPSIAETFRAWVMNTRNGALSEYTNFNFNSMAKFGNIFLAAGPNGVFVLGGATDAGTSISAAARTGKLNYGSSYLKRIPRLYVAHSTDGDLVFRTITQEGGTRSYLLRVNGITGEQQRRVPVGVGPKSVRWQFEIANRNGSDFEISSVLVYPKTLGRRIQ